MQKKFFYFFKKTTSLFDLKSCGKGLWGKTPHRTLTTKYTFIRYVPCAGGNSEPSLAQTVHPVRRTAFQTIPVSSKEWRTALFILSKVTPVIAAASAIER